MTGIELIDNEYYWIRESMCLGDLIIALAVKSNTTGKFLLYVAEDGFIEIEDVEVIKHIERPMI